MAHDKKLGGRNPRDSFQESTLMEWSGFVKAFEEAFEVTAAKVRAGGAGVSAPAGRHRAPLQNSPHARFLMAAVNMERSVDALGPALANVEVDVSPQLARSVQATENVWRTMDEEFGLLSSTEVSKAVGSKSPNRSYASEQRTAGRLLAIKRPGGFKYPGFQIDQNEHAIRPVMADLINVAGDAGRSEASLALWAVSTTGYLDGARPVDRLDEPETVIHAAREAFNVQW